MGRQVFLIKYKDVEKVSETIFVPKDIEWQKEPIDCWIDWNPKKIKAKVIAGPIPRGDDNEWFTYIELLSTDIKDYKIWYPSKSLLKSEPFRPEEILDELIDLKVYFLGKACSEQHQNDNVSDPVLDLIKSFEREFDRIVSKCQKN